MHALINKIIFCFLSSSCSFLCCFPFLESYTVYTPSSTPSTYLDLFVWLISWDIYPSIYLDQSEELISWDFFSILDPSTYLDPSEEVISWELSTLSSTLPPSWIFYSILYPSTYLESSEGLISWGLSAPSSTQSTYLESSEGLISWGLSAPSSLPGLWFLLEKTVFIYLSNIYICLNNYDKQCCFSIFISCNLCLSVCLIVFPIMTQEPLGFFALNFDWETLDIHGNVLILVLRF